MKTEKLYDEGVTKEEVVTLLTNWAEKALVLSKTVAGRAILTEIDMVNAMTEAEFAKYVALDYHGITEAIDVVKKRIELHGHLTKGVSHPFDDSSRILGTNINGRPLNGYVPDNNCGSRLYMVGSVAKEVVAKAISDKELPTDAEGNKADLNLHGIPISKTMLDSLKHHPQIVDEQYKAIRFTHVMSAEHATRLINDLNHLIEITSDAEYAEALSKEVQRLQYIADGKITKPSDVNYKWVQDRHF